MRYLHLGLHRANFRKKSRRAKAIGTARLNTRPYTLSQPAYKITSLRKNNGDRPSRVFVCSPTLYIMLVNVFILNVMNASIS